MNDDQLLHDIANLIDDYNMEESMKKAKQILDHIKKNSYEQKIVFDSRFDG